MSRAHIGKIRCQKCRASNPLGQELCVECGTRLMLISSTAGIRYQAESGGVVHDEHLLERVSALETHLLRLASRLEQVLELMLRQSRSAYFDHTLVETLIEVLSETKQIDGAKFDRRWRERCDRDSDKQGRERKHERIRDSVEKSAAQMQSSSQSSSQPSPQTSEVTQLVLTGFDLIENGKVGEGIKKLERAAASPPYVASLQRYLSEHFLRAGKMQLAHDYALRALDADPHDQGTMLLAGLTHADAGEADEAQKLLQRFINLGGKSFAACYAMGRILYDAGDWKLALWWLKQAIKIKPCAEAFYLVGALHFSRGQFRLAINYLKRSLDRDHEYIEAARTLAHAYLKTGEPELARQMFAIAGDDEANTSSTVVADLEKSGKTSGQDAKSRRATKATKATKENIGRETTTANLFAADAEQMTFVPSFIKMARAGSRGSILSGGNARLVSLIIADALEAVVER